jgi:hypothetical protein
MNRTAANRKKWKSERLSIVGNEVVLDPSIKRDVERTPVYTLTKRWKIAEHIHGSMYRLESLDYEGEWMYASHSKRYSEWDGWVEKEPNDRKEQHKNMGHLFPEDINLKGAMLSPKDTSSGYPPLIVVDQEIDRFRIKEAGREAKDYHYINPYGWVVGKI